MLAPVPGVISIAVQRGEDLLVAVGELHAFDDQVLPLLWREAVRHPQSQRQRPVIGHGGHAQLATRRFVPAAQHEELAATDILPVGQPLLMTGVAVLRQVALLAPEALGPEAQPDLARSNVRLQRRQPALEITKPSSLLVNLIKAAMLSSPGNLLLRPCNSPLQAIEPQLLLLLHRRHLPFQRHPHTVEHPSRYPVPLQVLALQRHRRPARRHLGKQLPLHLTEKLSVGIQGRVAISTLHRSVRAECGSDRWRPDAARKRPLGRLLDYVLGKVSWSNDTGTPVRDASRRQTRLATAERCLLA